MLQKIAIRKNVVENHQSVSGIAIFLKNTIVIKNAGACCTGKKYKRYIDDCLYGWLQSGRTPYDDC